MKRKAIGLLMSSIICLFTSMSAATVYNNIYKSILINTTDIPPNETQIDLHGSLVNSIGPNSVEAYYGNNCVIVCFHQIFGYVNITLTSDTGIVVYDNTVNTAVQQTFYIFLSDTSGGNYTLILDNANGYAEGDFAG